MARKITDIRKENDMKKEDVIIGKTYLFDPQGDSGFIPLEVNLNNKDDFITRVRVFSSYPSSNIDFVVVLLDKKFRGHNSCHDNLSESLEGRLWHVLAEMLSPVESDFDPKDESYKELFI